jgi:SAM-dependent methyltransferase
MKLHINQKIFFLLRKFYVFYNFYFIKKNNLNYYKPENPYDQNENLYSKKFSRAIHDVWVYMLKLSIKMFLKERNTNDYNFIDIGCGNGLPLVYAYKNYKFNTYKGIDLFEKSISRSRNNILNSNCDGINLLQKDASTFLLDDKKNFIFMFNPFSDEVMSKFLSNNINNIRKNNSVIAYINQISSSEVKIISQFKHKKLIENKFLGISLFFY